MTNQLDKRLISEIIGTLRNGKIDEADLAYAYEAIQKYQLPVQLTKDGDAIWDASYEELRPGLILDVLPVEYQQSISQIQCLDVTDSTNEYLLNEPGQVAGFSVCLADLQLKGRGRRGKNWMSQFGKNLLLSVSYSEDSSVVSGGLALQVGLNLRSALAQIAGIDFSLKWPNDILFNHEKVAGILMEAKAGRSSSRVVIGVGINSYPPPPAAIDSKIAAAGLSEIARKTLPGRNSLASSILRAIFEAVTEYQQSGLNFLEWNKQDTYKDSEVVLEQSGLVRRGVALGVDEEGNYQLQTETGLIKVSSSDASLRSVV